MPTLGTIAAHTTQALFVAITLFFAATTLCAIFNFAWRQPMFDQYHSYATFLTLPFPQNILQLDNGHRPIIPNLVRVAEIRWFAADQLLQISIGTLCAFLTSGVMALVAWRTRELPPTARAGSVMLVVLGVLWLGNARMLLHGNELLHAYLITFAVVCACLCTFHAQRTASLRWLAVACTACVISTFCFGPGIASFATVVLLGLLLRLPLRWLLMPLGVLAACLVLYLLVLPGDQGARGIHVMRPSESAEFAAQWLSSPWINGGLGLADPPASWIGVDHSSWHAQALAAAANAVVAPTGLGWRTLSIGIGLSGAFGFAARVLLAFTRRTALMRLEVLAIGIGVFVLASAAVIGVARLDYFENNPDQVYADRYLMWPSLFWSSLALLLLIDISRSRSRVLQYAGIILLFTLPLILSATQRGQADWGSLVYRNSQRNAAALRSGVFDETCFVGNGPVALDNDLHTVDLLRANGLAMFADPLWQRVGSHWEGTLEHNAAYSVETQRLERFEDVRTGMPAARFGGWVTRGIAAMPRGGQLAVLAEDGTIAGLAEYSFISPNASALRLDIPRKRGFDGYIFHYDPEKMYTFALLEMKEGRGHFLTFLNKPDAAERP